MGRLVITHSTYIEGLIPLLRRLVEEEGITTVTPAVIGRVRGRSSSLQLRPCGAVRSISSVVHGPTLPERDRQPR